MSLQSDWKMGKFLEWYTKLPLENRPRQSPTFLVQNTQCYFFFKGNYEGPQFFYCLYLKTKLTDLTLKPFSFILYSDCFKSGAFTTSKANFTNSSNYVYAFAIGSTAVSNRGSFPGSSCLIKFCFLFKSEDGPMLPLEPKVELGDKSVQTGSYLNAGMNVESLPEDFSKMLETGIYHDAAVKCGELSIKAHKLVLSARSEVFKAMLESDMREGRSGILEIKDIDANYFQDFMKYLYTGVMPELDLDKAKVLYEVGDKYAIRSLMLRCSDYLQDNLYPEIIFECLVLADAHSDQKLKDKIVKFILDKKIYRESENWSPICENFPKVAVEIYRLSYEENRKE